MKFEIVKMHRMHIVYTVIPEIFKYIKFLLSHESVLSSRMKLNVFGLN